MPYNQKSPDKIVLWLPVDSVRVAAMAGSGGQDEVDRGVDLTRSDDPREQVPTFRGYGTDIRAIRAQANLTVFKWFNLSLDLGGTSRSANRAVAYFMVTCAAMIPAALCGVICLLARASTEITLLTCLAVGAISGAVALVPYRQLRHGRLAEKAGRRQKNCRKRGRGRAKKSSGKGRRPPKRTTRPGKRGRNRRGPRR